MKRWLLLLCVTLPLGALELSIQSGKEKKEPYSILNIRDTSPFVCTPSYNDFKEIQSVICQFRTKATKTFSPINNPHFIVEHQNDGGRNRIIVTPKTKIILQPILFDLTKEPQIYFSSKKETRHWNIIGYRKTPPMLVLEKTDKGINFPVKLAKEPLPYVGGLDLKGNPIKLKRVQDVNDYIDMKKAYAKKDYSNALFLAENTLKEHPDSVFKNELLLYQIRALHHLDESEKLLLLAKEFLREYSGDTNIAEVLAYTADAYSKVGLSNDADYFYDRLFEEHIKSPYAAQGMYFRARYLEKTGNSNLAMKYYRRGLAVTKDVSLASEIAFRLAVLEMQKGRLEQAKGYIDNIANVYPEHFREVSSDALDLVNRLVEKQEYMSAAKIVNALIKTAIEKSDEHEILLRKLGQLYAQAGEKSKALTKFNEYLEIFPYGDGLAEVEKAKDGLFFEKNEPKGDAGIKKYDALIERYGNDPVGKNALYKKAQLLFKEGKFEKVLDIENDLYHLQSKEYPEVNKLISQSAIGLTKKRLEEGKCAEAIKLHRMYRVKLLPKWDPLTFDCALKMGNFPVAKKIAQGHIKATNMKERQEWLLRLVKTHFEQGEYKEALKGGKELITLLEIEKNPQADEIYRVMFDASERIGDGEGMIRYIKGCEASFGLTFKDIERYTQTMSLGLKRKDEVLVQNYAQKVMTLQERTKTYTQSPFVEFTLAQSLINQDKNKEALSVLKTLDERKLNGERRSRQYYLIGSLALKLGQNAEANRAFNASIKADPASAWGKLAKEALAL